METANGGLFEKPLSEISFAQVLINLFNTARRFNMQVQPQLVLLQKTLLYIEGLGRQLYPQLDLWDTAKPFLESWMLEQVSPKTLLKKLKLKAPFWLEKLPDIPELVYHNLAQTKQIQQQQQQLIQRLNEQQQKNSKSQVITALAITFSLIAALFYLQSNERFSLYFSLPAVISWVLAWRFTNKP